MVNKKLGILFLASVILAFFAGFFTERILPSSPETNTTDMFEYIIESFDRYYYYDIDDEDVHDAFISAMEATINKIAEKNGDPYTRLLATPLASGATDDEKFVGIGISFLFEENDIRIGYVYPQGAAHLKLYPYDLIIGVKQTDEMIYFKDLEDSDEVLELISGSEGDVKEFIVKDADGNENIVSISYQEILTPTAYSKDLSESNIAYIKIESFASSSETSPGTAQVFQNTLNALEQTILQGENKTLILDLRDNPGGALTALHNQGVSQLIPGITQQLLTRNLEAPLFTMIPKSGTVESFFGALAEKKPYDIKVLVNENSASAAEVLAAALQSKGGYELYGRPTFGKGVYQNQVRLQDINNIRYYLVFTEGEWFYDGDKNVSDTPLVVNELPKTGIKSLDAPVYMGEMSYDHVYQELIDYQKFFNLYFDLTGLNQLREDGYFDLKTRDRVQAFNLEYGITGQTISLETARKVHEIYMDYLFDLTKDDELQELILIIKNS